MYVCKIPCTHAWFFFRFVLLLNIFYLLYIANVCKILYFLHKCDDAYMYIYFLYIFKNERSDFTFKGVSLRKFYFGDWKFLWKTYFYKNFVKMSCFGMKNFVKGPSKYLKFFLSKSLICIFSFYPILWNNSCLKKENRYKSFIIRKQ